MDVSGIRMMSAALPTTPNQAAEAVGGMGATFGDLLKNALGSVTAADYGDKSANVALLTGQLDDMHTATIAAEKADIVLQLTLQIRNKAVDAYNEIMRMQV